jgi:hypothetical protein
VSEWRLEELFRKDMETTSLEKPLELLKGLAGGAGAAALSGHLSQTPPPRSLQGRSRRNTIIVSSCPQAQGLGVQHLEACSRKAEDAQWVPAKVKRSKIWSFPACPGVLASSHMWTLTFLGTSPGSQRKLIFTDIVDD